MTANVTNKTIGTSNISRLVVQTDMLADTIYFYLSKTHDEVDISGYTWYISYENENGEGDTVLLEKTTSTTTFTLAWQPTGYATSKEGQLKFNIYGMSGDTVKWNTFPAYITIAGSVDATTTGGFTPTVLDQYLVLFEAARNRAETAADTAEGVLTDADFIAVSTDLALGDSSTIKIVSGDLVDIGLVAGVASDITAVAGDLINIDIVAGKADDITIVANGIGDIDRVEDIASEITTVAGISANVTTVAGISANVTTVAGDTVPINTVATDLDLGASSKTKIVADNIDDITTVAGVSTEVTALAGKTTEIDAIYSEIDAIGAKATYEALATESSARILKDVEQDNRLDTHDKQLEVTKTLDSGDKRTSEEDITINGVGYDDAGDPLTDIASTVVDGRFGSMLLKGKGASNLVDGADIADGGSVSWDSTLNNIYYDLLNNTLLTGTGSSMTATNSSGATADMAIFDVTDLGLASYLDTAEKASRYFNFIDYANSYTPTLPMLWESVGKNLFDKSKATKGFFLNLDGSSYAITTGAYSEKIRVIPLSNLYRNTTSRMIIFDANLNVIQTNIYTNLITIPSNGAWVQYNLLINDLDTAQLEYGSTATTYEPYKVQSIQIPYLGYRLPNLVANTYSPETGEEVRNVKEYTLTGSEVSLATEDTVTDRYFITLTGIPTPTTDNEGVVWIPSKRRSLYADRNTLASDDSYFTYASGLNPTLVYVVESGTFATLAEAQAYLADTFVCYQLATPVTIQHAPIVPTLFDGGSQYLTPNYADSFITDASSQFTIPYSTSAIESVYGYDEDGEYLVDSDYYTLASDVVTMLTPYDGENVVYYCRATLDEDATLTPTTSGYYPVENIVTRVEDLEAKVCTEIADADAGTIVAQFNALLAELKAKNLMED